MVAEGAAALAVRAGNAGGAGRVTAERQSDCRGEGGRRGEVRAGGGRQLLQLPAEGSSQFGRRGQGVVSGGVKNSTWKG